MGSFADFLRSLPKGMEIVADNAVFIAGSRLSLTLKPKRKLNPRREVTGTVCRDRAPCLPRRLPDHLCCERPKRPTRRPSITNENAQKLEEFKPSLDVGRIGLLLCASDQTRKTLTAATA